MQQNEISNWELSNPITRSLDLSVDAPLSVIISRKIDEYPNLRKKALEELNADLEKKYQEVESRTKDVIAQRQNELRALEITLTTDRENKENSISSVSEEIEYYNTEIESLTYQIQKDTRAIRWMNVWRVIWGILCTVGIILTVILTVVGFIFEFIAFMAKDDKNGGK